MARHRAALAPLATADPWYGVALMFAFGLGTVPNLLAIGVFGIVRATHPLAHAAGTFSLSGKILAGDQR